MLTDLSPAQFGTAAQRNYVFSSIVGMRDNTPAATTWPPSAPVESTTCDNSDSPGLSYQAVSIATGGTRFPICSYDDYRPIFFDVADTARPARIECP